jgi:Uma2 family endonuclease
MSEALQSGYRMTIEAFRALVDDRPDHEKWELIDGEMILNPTPANRHQVIVANVLYELESFRRRTGAAWRTFPGIGTRHPDDQHNEVVPDLMIVPRSDDVTNWTYDVLVAFEVLSPGSVRRDMVRKRAFYTRLDTLTHYVVLAQDRREATIFARNADFVPRPISADGIIAIEPLGLSLPLAEVYRDILLD